MIEQNLTNTMTETVTQTKSPLALATGAILRAARKRKHMTQAELARRTGLSVRMIAYVESADAVPTLATYLALCRELNLDPAPTLERITARAV